jgi:hypothetical protein
MRQTSGLPLEFGHFTAWRRGNPEGIVSLSPGLRAASYPGCGRPNPLPCKGCITAPIGVWTFYCMGKGQSRRDCIAKPRVASSELPWVGDGLGGQPYHLCHMAFVIYGTISPLGSLDPLVLWARSSGLRCGGERSEPERRSPEERVRRLAVLPMSRQTITSHRHDQ